MKISLPKIDKKVVKYTIFGILLVVFCIILLHSCNLGDRVSRLQGELRVANSILTETEKIAEKNIGKSLAKIDDLQKDTSKLKVEVSNSMVKIGEKDELIVRMEDELYELRVHMDSSNQLENLQEQVVNLEGQVNTWKEKFTLAQKIITDKDSVIFNLKQQYTLQINISADYKKLYEDTKDVLNRSEVLIGITKRKLRTAKFGGTFKTIAIGVLGGYVAFKLLK